MQTLLAFGLAATLASAVAILSRPDLQAAWRKLSRKLDDSIYDNVITPIGRHLPKK